MPDPWKVLLADDGCLRITWKGRRVAEASRPLDISSRNHPGVLVRQSLRNRKYQATVILPGGARVAMTSRFRVGKKTLLPTLFEDREVRFLDEVPEGLLRVRYDLLPGEKARDGFPVIPALWYGDNEAWNDAIDYPKGLDKDWSFKADGSSCPAVVWSGRRSSYAVGMAAALSIRTGRPGLDDVWGIGFEDALKRPKAVFSFPAQEIPQSYPWGHKLKAPLTPRFRFRKGTVLKFTILHQAGAADRGFHARVWRSRFSSSPSSLRYRPSPNRLDQTASLFTHCLKESHFHPGKGFSHRHDIREIFSGWCGGFAAAYAALRWGDASGDREFRRMGETMADFICSKGVSPSRLFYSEYVWGRWLEKTFWGKGRGIPMRNPSEGSCYLALMLAYEKSMGRRRPLWEKALLSNLEAVLGWMKRNGSLPQEVDGRTGKPLSWVGATPAAWAGALARFSRIDEDRRRARRYLAAAKKIGDHYRMRYVERERYIGGPYDTFMAPNMEDPYNLLLAYGELYAATGEKRWLVTEKRVADHLLSWRYLHDVRFPDRTWCRRQKVKTFAMSPASVSNKHIQNWDTLADPYLLDLSRRSGDPLYADQAVQHLYASTQLVQRGQLPKRIPYGGQSEQWYATTFNWFGDSGPYSKGNVWQISVSLPKAGFLISMSELKKPFILRGSTR